MAITFPENNRDFELDWTNLSGKISGIATAINLLNERASNLFIQRKDDAANNVREMATHLERIKSGLDRDLQEFIKESHRRNYEVQRAQPGHPPVVNGPGK